MQFITNIKFHHQGRTNPTSQIARASTFCTMTLNICWFSVWNFLHIIPLTPRILRRPSNFVYPWLTSTIACFPKLCAEKTEKTLSYWGYFSWKGNGMRIIEAGVLRRLHGTNHRSGENCKICTGHRILLGWWNRGGWEGWAMWLA